MAGASGHRDVRASDSRARPSFPSAAAISDEGRGSARIVIELDRAPVDHVSGRAARLASQHHAHQRWARPVKESVVCG